MCHLVCGCSKDSLGKGNENVWPTSHNWKEATKRVEGVVNITEGKRGELEEQERGSGGAREGIWRSKRGDLEEQERGSGGAREGIWRSKRGDLISKWLLYMYGTDHSICLKC